MTPEKIKVACVIPTYNGLDDLKRLIDSLRKQSFDFDTIVIDSESKDGTAEYAKSNSDVFISIRTSEFNHGGTRSLAVELNSDYDYFIFLTQDAYLERPDALRNILEPFSDDSVGAVCGRQLPHLDANLLSQHARYFNYPTEVSERKDKSTIGLYGIKTVFISNSFSAYRASAFRAVGGFPHHVILSEDMFLAAKLVLSNWSIVYAGNAECRHSHNYTLVEEFKRYFDIGVFQSRERWISENFGGASGEGLRYIFSEIRFLGVKRFYLWPFSLFRNFVKLIGYKVGKMESKLPLNIKKKLSMHRRFWDSKFAEEK